MINFNPPDGGQISNYKLFFCLFVCSLICLFPHPALAQTYSFAVWPPLLEVVIQPGKSITQVYQLINSGDDQTIGVRVSYFEPSDSKGNINLIPAPQLLKPLGFSLDGTDISVPKSFFLKTGETKNLLLKISIPPRCPERDFYASLVFETIPEVRTGLSQAQTIAKIATNILITVSVSETPVKKARIVEFSAPKIVDSFDPVPFTLKVENIGAAYLKPFGNVTIQGIFNQKGQIQILPENILPQYSRDLKIPSWKNKFIVGPFKAEVAFTLDEEGEKISEELTFLALPYKLILSLIVISLILLSFSNLPKKAKE